MNLVQPDMLVVCDNENKNDMDRYTGIPTLVIEIISHSSTRMDLVRKLDLYMQTGVKEYWIVEPEGKLVSVFILQNDLRYGRPETYTEDDEIKISIFPDLIVDLKPVFEGI